MQTDKPNISEKDRNSILIQIINCANCALLNEDAFRKAMMQLADAFRVLFEGEFCSIGIVNDGYAEDIFISFEHFNDEKLSKLQYVNIESVKRINIDDNDSWIVARALKSNEIIYSLPEKTIEGFNHFPNYQRILFSGDVKNSCVIPIRDHEKKAYGFIQFINTKKSIDFERDIMPYRDALLGLVQIIINNQKNQQELVKKENRLKDADFYNIMQDKTDNVNELLDSIMEYFSREFNAAVITFRIPVLNGYKKEPIFYLRRVFVHPSVKNQEEVVNQYYEERLVKNKDGMNIADDLRCDLEGKVFENISDLDFSEFTLDLYNNTLIIPIFRDSGNKCIHPQRTNCEYCESDEHIGCEYRFKRLYGIFRLRISKTELTGNGTYDHLIYEEMKERLEYLSKQISFLLNSIVNRQENLSLQFFQNKLKNCSFTKITDFDESCVQIIKDSVFAEECSIYRYNELTKQLSLSATTAKYINFKADNNDFRFKKEQIIKNCFINTFAKNNLLIQALQSRIGLYVMNIKDARIHQSHFIEFIKGGNESAMVIPMIKKDGSCIGVVLILGKMRGQSCISTIYCEYDIDHIEFIVNMLTRMSESDTEKLTFIAQLSHELLAPVTELVYDNDLTVNMAERDPESFSREQLISKICENINRNMRLKYIISDTEFIYSSGNRGIDYNIIKQEAPQGILLEAVRLLEQEANYKGLTIQTNISEMPSLYFDKERMIQVFINLLKNAIRYSDSGTEINVSYDKRNDDFHEICFANDGIGVQEEEKEIIFELFYRGEEAKKKMLHGTGMGLYVVRNIMRAHGGDCYVRNLNNPTEFVITFPNIE